jgi:hypothetical protein
MDRIASLVKYAQGIRRRLWASLPFGYRLARLFESLSEAFIVDWGRQLGALLLQQGIEGMPDPGPNWDPNRPDPRRLPRGYLKAEALVAYRIALQKLKNPDDAVDALQDVLLKLTTGGSKIQPGVPLSMAMSYIRQGVNFTCLNIIRARKTSPHLVPTLVDEEGKPVVQDESTSFMDNPYWLENPDSYRDLMGVFDERVWRHRVLPELAKIHPSVPKFLDIKLEHPNMSTMEVIRHIPEFEKSPKTLIRILQQKVGPRLKQLAEALS